MKNVLNKIPTVVTTSLNFLSNKTRLIIEYFLIAAIVIIAASTFTLWLEKVRLEDSLMDARHKLVIVQNKLNHVEHVNNEQQEILMSLRYYDSKCCEVFYNCSLCFKSITPPLSCNSFHNLHD